MSMRVCVVLKRRDSGVQDITLISVSLFFTLQYLFHPKRISLDLFKIRNMEVSPRPQLNGPPKISFSYSLECLISP